MLSFRRILCPLLVLLTTLLLFSMVPESAEAQLFSRLRAHCRPQVCNPCPCPCPTPSVVACDPCAVCPPYSVIGPPTECACGECTYYYNTGAGAWRYKTLACKKDCICVLPTEIGGIRPINEFSACCSKEIPEDHFGLTFELKLGSNAARQCLLVLPNGTTEMTTKKYQLVEGSGHYWEIAVYYGDGITEIACPLPGEFNSNGTSKVTITNTGTVTRCHSHVKDEECVVHSHDKFTVMIRLVEGNLLETD